MLSFPSHLAEVSAASVGQRDLTADFKTGKQVRLHAQPSGRRSHASSEMVGFRTHVQPMEIKVKAGLMISRVD